MFHFHQEDEFNVQFPNKKQNTQQDQDPILSRFILESSDLGMDNIVGDTLHNSLVMEERKDGIITNKDKKRMGHKDIERQRRQLMAHLFVSLRSLLPLEYIKGKRSKSDYMHEAVAYIKHLKKNINELEIQREELKLLHESNSHATASRSSESSTFTVSPYSGGVEILINSRCGKEGIPISRILGVLIDERLKIVSYVSTKVNERVIHTINSQVDRDLVCVNPSLLQQKLYGVLNS